MFHTELGTRPCSPAFERNNADSNSTHISLTLSTIFDHHTKSWMLSCQRKPSASPIVHRRHAFTGNKLHSFPPRFVFGLYCQSLASAANDPNAFPSCAAAICSENNFESAPSLSADRHLQRSLTDSLLFRTYQQRGIALLPSVP